jgi:hypothetical protein
MSYAVSSTDIAQALDRIATYLKTATHRSTP